MNIFLKTEDEIDLMCETKYLTGATLTDVGKPVNEGDTIPLLYCLTNGFVRDYEILCAC
ncbi:hypothetical protein [Hoylesella buccalis]|uniref:hypothetical protein n=1 Tax=Hoylesella buccalis TaxID=28127 RepID=UPI0039954546